MSGLKASPLCLPANALSGGRNPELWDTPAPQAPLLGSSSPHTQGEPTFLLISRRKEQTGVTSAVFV